MMNKSPKYICLKEIHTASEYMERMQINVLPVLNPAGKVVDIVIRDGSGSVQIPILAKHLLKDVDVVIHISGLAVMPVNICIISVNQDIAIWANLKKCAGWNRN